MLLVSDTNILLDWESGGELAVLFRLGVPVAVPDVLAAEELGDRLPELLGLGLQVRSLAPAGVQRVVALTRTYARPSRVDLTALALAEQERAVLLTGDRDLRIAAAAEQVEVHGTLWLAERAVGTGAISGMAMRDAFQRMQRGGRRLPWAEVSALVRRW